MQYAYYPGCSLHSTAKEYGSSTQAVADSLNIELKELPDWICCGATPAHATDYLLSIVLPIKNLTLSQHIANDLVTTCAACYNRLKSAHKKVIQDSELKLKVDKIIGEKYTGQVRIRHFLDVLQSDIGIDTIKNRVKKELHGLKVASYYGCLLTRPPKVVEFDDPEDPQVMDNLVTVLGGESIPWAYKTECCGASFSLSRTDIVLKLSFEILQIAKELGAECIIVACPLCQSNLDLRQKEIEKKYRTSFNLPILYFTQLIGLSLGLDEKSLGLKKLIVDPIPLFRTKNLV